MSIPKLAELGSPVSPCPVDLASPFALYDYASRTPSPQPSHYSTPLSKKASAQRSWEQIPLDAAPQLDGNTPHQSGWTLHAFDCTMTAPLRIPSERVMQTSGSLNYITEFNQHGPSARSRFHVCADFVHGYCPRLGSCPDIHSRDLGTSPPPSATIHVNAQPSRFPLLPPGQVITVYNPNNRSQSSEIPSERVLVTRGSEAYWANPALGLRQFHCAHFYLRKMCNRGPLQLHPRAGPCRGGRRRNGHVAGTISQRCRSQPRAVIQQQQE
jgi:hypothetical protein